MAKSARVTELEDTVADIKDKADNAGTTREDMNEALDSIIKLCVEACPDLDETEEDDSEDD